MGQKRDAIVDVEDNAVLPMEFEDTGEGSVAPDLQLDYTLEDLELYF
jgi:hypothetical protein